MSERHGVAAFPGDLAFGAGSHCFASIGNNSFRREPGNAAQFLMCQLPHAATSALAPALSFDLQKQRDEFALAMRVRLGKDGFQLIARRLP